MDFIDLKAQQKKIRSSLNERIKKVLDDGAYIGGEEIKLFENELSLFSGSKHSIGCSNGTDAIMLALLALGVKPGDGAVSYTHLTLPTK